MGGSKHLRQQKAVLLATEKASRQLDLPTLIVGLFGRLVRGIAVDSSWLNNPSSHLSAFVTGGIACAALGQVTWDSLALVRLKSTKLTPSSSHFHSYTLSPGPWGRQFRHLVCEDTRRLLPGVGCMAGLWIIPLIGYPLSVLHRSREHHGATSTLLLCRLQKQEWRAAACQTGSDWVANRPPIYVSASLTTLLSGLASSQQPYPLRMCAEDS